MDTYPVRRNPNRVISSAVAVIALASLNGCSLVSDRHSGPKPGAPPTRSMPSPRTYTKPRPGTNSCRKEFPKSWVPVQEAPLVPREISRSLGVSTRRILNGEAGFVQCETGVTADDVKSFADEAVLNIRGIGDPCLAIAIRSHGEPTPKEKYSHFIAVCPEPIDGITDTA